MIRQMDAGAAADGQQPQVLRIEQGEALPLPLQQHSVRAALILLSGWPLARALNSTGALQA
jgi:hypothetical protein